METKNKMSCLFNSLYYPGYRAMNGIWIGMDVEEDSYDLIYIIILAYT